MTQLRAARVFDGVRMHEDACVSSKGGVITGIVPSEHAETELSPDWVLAPGFVDLQVNGAGGVLFNDDTSHAALERIAAALAPLGTTAFLPTLISARSKIPAALAATAAARAAGVAAVLGVHIEGPFINPVRRGIHPQHEIVSLTDADLALLTATQDGIRLITLAPECAAAERIAALARHAVLFVGHSDATAEQVEGGLASGMRGFTHLFNAMSQFGSRAPGCVGAALAHEDACASLICDLAHVHKVAVRAAWHAMGPERLFFVSDCMPTVGAGPGYAFTWDGTPIALRDGRLTRPDGTLAGAHVTMAECVARAVHACGIPLEHALRMATETPARQVGAAAVGRLAPGCRADMVALDAALVVQAVWQGGTRVL